MAGGALIKRIEERLIQNDLPAYTMVVDPGRKQRDWDAHLRCPAVSNPERFATISAPDYDRYVREQFKTTTELGNALRSEFPEIANANPSYFDVNVKSRRASEKYVKQLENDEVDLDAQRQDFYGFRPARERFEEFYREAAMGDQGGGTGAGSNQQGAIDPRLAATLPGAGLLGAVATEPTTQEKLEAFSMWLRTLARH